MRHGEPIRDVALPNSFNPKISYNQRFGEFEACIEAGLDIYEWEYGNKYSLEFKAAVLVWHEDKGLIASHVKSAKQKKQEQINKRNSKR